MDVRRLRSEAEVAEVAAEILVERARDAVAARGVFRWCVTGGRSPQALYRLLATAAVGERIAWDRTVVAWGDERAVPDTSPANNARLASALLFDHVAVPPAQVLRIPVDVPADVAAQRYEATLRQIVFPDESPRFDVLLLGLGDDGHVASLFPGSTALQEDERWVVKVAGKAGGPDRVTLTFPVINAARLILAQVFGAQKGRVLRRVLAGEQNLPATQVAPRRGELVWLVDPAAASALEVAATG